MVKGRLGDGSMLALAHVDLVSWAGLGGGGGVRAL